MFLRKVLGVIAVLAFVCAGIAGEASAQQKKSAAKPAAKPSKPKAKAAKEEEATGKQIWTYRSRYQFDGETVKLDIAQDNGEWRFYQGEGEGDIIADPLGFEITLADGTRIGNADMKLGHSDRTVAEDPRFGPGVYYQNDFLPVKGLKISQRAFRFNNRPFLTVRLLLENTGTSPVQITRIAPIHVAPGAMKGFRPETQTHTHCVLARGGFAVPDASHAPIMTRFFDPGRKVCLGVGVLPESRGDAACVFKKEGTAWVGSAETNFEPALTLAPGAKGESDPVFLNFSTPSPEASDLFYTWALSTALRRAPINKGPESWVTVAPGESVDALRSAAEFWGKRTVKYVLCRSTMDDDPRDLMAALKKTGLKVGFELDPLEADGEKGDWVIDGGDGSRWLDPSKAGAQDYLKARAAKLKKADAAFIVIGFTRAPMAVLNKIGLPREAAVDLAVNAIESGVKGMFVYGAPGAPVDATQAAVAEAATVVGSIINYGVWPAVLEIAITGDARAQLLAAQKAWPGPLQVVGKAGN